MIKVLVNAYAVAPNWGSEQGMAWNWIVGLAEYCDVYVITEGEWRAEIESALETNPRIDRIHFYYNPVSPRIRKMCWNQGDWRFYLYYHKWQKKTLSIAKKICHEENIDITHQLNMIGFREPGLLWKIDGVKHVWGPVGSMGEVPTAFLEGASWSVKFKQNLKNTITSFQIKHGPVSKAVKGNDAIVAALDVTRDKVYKTYGISIPVISETGLYPNAGFDHRTCEGRPIDLLWVGRFIPTKKLEIAIEAIARTKNPDNFRLHIVGGGTQQEENIYKALARDCGVDHLCKWYGKIPNSEVQAMMREKDIMFFTSVFEGGPHVILEAISNNLPILCFDTCGQGVVTDSSVGIKVPLTTLQEGVDSFAEKLDYVDNNRSIILELSRNCTNKQFELSWDNKVKALVKIYHDLLK